MIFIIWEYRDDRLWCGLWDGERYREVDYPADSLEHSVIDPIEQEGTIEGIAVARDGLKSFASSRLILSTLNALAWARNIPIVPVPADRARTSLEALAGRIKELRTFQEAVLPLYARPPDITPSTKKPSFRLT